MPNRDDEPVIYTGPCQYLEAQLAYWEKSFQTAVDNGQSDPKVLAAYQKEIANIQAQLDACITSHGGRVLEPILIEHPEHP
jgi:hypothetical protein